MDILSNVLKSVRLEGALYLEAQFTAPWCMRGRYGRSSVRQRLAGAEHVLFFHFVAAGSCQVRLVEGGDVVALSEGDLILFAQDDRHLIGSDLNVAPLEAENFNSDREPGPELARLQHGGGGAVTRFVCGYLACNRDLCRPLLQALPRLLRVPIGDGPAVDLLGTLLELGVRESRSPVPGTESTMAKLAELMLVDALRRHAASLPAGGQGWLAALRDPQVGRALALMHDHPHRPWTVETVARQTGVSRSTLADRFVALVGEPPMHYLMRWRLALAARALRASSEAISRIAERCGYESEAAFNRAFRREFGAPPAAWRRSAPPMAVTPVTSAMTHGRSALVGSV